MVVALLAMTSCEKSDLGGSLSGETATITISAAATSVTRTLGDTYEADGAKLTYYVDLYLDSVFYRRYTDTFEADANAVFDVELFTETEYEILAWADYGQGYYKTDNLKEVTIDTVKYAINTTARDAFAGKATINVSDPEKCDVSMKLVRPFGRVNVLSKDDIPSGFEPYEVSTTYTTIYTTYDISTGQVGGEKYDFEVKASTVDVLENDKDFSGDLSTDYLFAPGEDYAERLAVDFKQTYYAENGTTITSYNFTNIPFEANYQTNISGKILTDGGTINIDVTDTWGGTIVPEDEIVADIALIEEIYYIYSAKGLCAFSDLVNGKANTYAAVTSGENFASFEQSNENICGTLTTDIDLSEVCSAELGNWSPIGKSSAYTGTFDGGGFEVKNLYGGSLFNTISGATIKNVGIGGTTTGDNMSAAIVCNASSSTITNCYNTTDFSLDNGAAIVGTASGSIISKCYNTGNIEAGDDNNGGIVGYACESTEITDCYNSGNISSDGSYTGGIVGQLTYSTVTACYNTGNVTGLMDVGGIVGYAQDSATVTACYNHGDVVGMSGSGYSEAGGVVGYASSATVKSCYSSGSVSAKNIYYLGGVLGFYRYSTITYCYYDTSTVNGNNETYTSYPSAAVYGLGDSEDSYYGYVTKYMQDGTLLTKLQTGADGYWESGGEGAYPILSWQVATE